MSIIIGIYGLQGWGKTALTTYLGIRAKSNGIPVFSNYPLKKIDYTFIETVKDAQNIRNGIALFDEFWEWAHARTSQSKINKLLMEICLLNRKRGVSIVYNSQLPRTIDVILKDVTNYRYLPQMVEHTDGKKYIHYITRDLLGNYSEENIIPFPIDVIGSYFDTRAEVKKLDKEMTPLEKGIGLEKEFLKAIRKCKNINYADLIPNSGNGSSWVFDVVAYSNKGVYAFDVKGSNKTRVYLMEYGKTLLKKIDNAKSHKAKPFLVFPNNSYVNLGISNAWFIYELKETSYLKALNSQPFYNKLKGKSKILSNFNF